MSTNALDTQGVLLKRGDGASPEVFSSVAELLDFDGPSGAPSVRDVSDLSSTSMQKKLGLIDEGQFSFEVFLTPNETVQAGLIADRTAKTLRNFTLTLTDSPATVLSFAAYVLSVKPGGSKDDDIKGSITLEISGLVTWS